MKGLFIAILFSAPCLIFSQANTDKVIIDANTDIFSASSTDEGLSVEKMHTGNSDIPAIRGINNVTDYYGIGLEGIGGYIGVNGICNGAADGHYYGMIGGSTGSNIGVNYGVLATASNGNQNYGLYASCSGGPNSYSGYFNGQVFIKQRFNDDVYFQIQNKTGTNVLTIADNDVVEVNRFKSNWFTEMDSLKTNWYTELSDVNATGNTTLSNVTTNGSTDLEIESGKRINKATSMRYFIATSGAFPLNGTFTDGILIGEIKLFPYNYSPGGWMPCEGQILNIVDHTSLFSLIGFTYGGDGTNTFALPDMRNAVPHHN